MLFNLQRFIAILTIGLIMTCAVTTVQAEHSGVAMYQSKGEETSILLKTDRSWNGALFPPYPSGQPQLIVLKSTIAPNTRLPWHTHPFPCAAYITSGELIVETKDGLHKTVSPGSVVPELVGSVHRGFTGDKPVELIFFCAGISGKPFVIKEK
jgi:quercetin dioxygenase-like cupin family protein